MALKKKWLQFKKVEPFSKNFHWGAILATLFCFSVCQFWTVLTKNFGLSNLVSCLISIWTLIFQFLALPSLAQILTTPEQLSKIYITTRIDVSHWWRSHKLIGQGQKWGSDKWLTESFETDTDISSAALAIHIQDIRCPAVKDHRKQTNVHVKPISWENDRMTSK